MASLAVFLVFSGGTFGYYFLCDGERLLVDCAYMTAVTLSTVGYNEVIPVMGIAKLQIFTMGLLFVGMGTILYFVSTTAAFIIEGDLTEILRRRQMDKRIGKLGGHYIVCGVGRSGIIATRELLDRGLEVVGVDMDETHLDRIESDQDISRFHSILGDATEDSVLEQAGVSRAKGLISALPDDRDNLYVTFSARQMNPTLRIVSKAVHKPHRIENAGADAVVAPAHLGGHRMFIEATRPRISGLI